MVEDPGTSEMGTQLHPLSLTGLFIPEKAQRKLGALNKGLPLLSVNIATATARTTAEGVELDSGLSSF